MGHTRGVGEAARVTEQGALAEQAGLGKQGASLGLGCPSKGGVWLSREWLSRGCTRGGRLLRIGGGVAEQG